MNVRLMRDLAGYGTRRELRLARFLGVCLMLASSAGCGRPLQEEQSAAPAQAVVVPHLTKIASPAYAAAFAAPPSASVDIDRIDPPGASRAHPFAVSLKTSQSLTVLGWAFPGTEKGGCSAIGLTVDNKHVFPGT